MTKQKYYPSAVTPGAQRRSRPAEQGKIQRDLAARQELHPPDTNCEHPVHSSTTRLNSPPPPFHVVSETGTATRSLASSVTLLSRCLHRRRTLSRRYQPLAAHPQRPHKGWWWPLLLSLPLPNRPEKGGFRFSAENLGAAKAPRGLTAQPLQNPRREGGNAPGLRVQAVVTIVERSRVGLERPMGESTSEAVGLCISILKGSSIAGTKLFKSQGELDWRLEVVGIAFRCVYMYVAVGVAFVSLCLSKRVKNAQGFVTSGTTHRMPHT